MQVKKNEKDASRIFYFTGHRLYDVIQHRFSYPLSWALSNGIASLYLFVFDCTGAAGLFVQAIFEKNEKGIETQAKCFTYDRGV